MAFPTTADIELLEEAIRTAITDGTWRVQSIAFDDQVMQLRSMKEATDLLAWMKTAVTDGTTPRTRYAAHSRGSR